MSDSPAVGFGGFLVGFGLGWFVFSTLELTGNTFAWVMIIGGAAVVATSIFSRRRSGPMISGLVGGVMGGLILSLFVTTGFGFVDMFNGGSAGAYRAETTESFTGAMTADSVYLSVDNFNGPVSISTWDRSEYSVELLIRAKGTTTSQAENNLEEFVIDFDESVVQGEGRLVLAYGIPVTDYNKYSVQVEAFLPADALIDLELESSNGAISLSLPCTVTGDYILRTSNGQVDLRVSSSSAVGYDLDASTGNGVVSFGLPSLEYSVNQRTSKEARTQGFQGKEIQITIDVSTSNGDLDID